MTALPPFVTHTFHPARGPFHNLCALPTAEAEVHLAAMRAVGRCLSPTYLARRHTTEEWLRATRTAKLGVTPLAHPVYLFLGDFADGRDPARPSSLTFPLARLPSAALTFTYGDSMSVHEAFTLPEITALVAERGLPPRDTSFIEVQLWDLAPLAGHLSVPAGPD